MHPAFGLLVAYLAGSIPSAYLAGKSRGIDLRQHGSGNLGTTNVFRVLGPVLGILVFLVDALKGALPVMLLPDATGLAGTGVRAELWAMAFGVMAIVGHVKPVFLLRSGGGGGKGVATATGVFAALAPAAIGILAVVFLAVLFVSGYVSLASLVGAALLPPLLWLTQGTSALFWLSLGVVTFVFWAHRGNIGRLRRGEESGFGRRKAAAGESGAPPAGGEPGREA